MKRRARVLEDAIFLEPQIEDVFYTWVHCCKLHHLFQAVLRCVKHFPRHPQHFWKNYARQLCTAEVTESSQSEHLQAGDCDELKKVSNSILAKHISAK